VTPLFFSLTFCHCGTKLYVPSNSPKYTCYQCRNKIPVPDLEAISHEEIKGFVFSKTEIEKYLSEHHGRLHEREEALASLAREHGPSHKRWPNNFWRNGVGEAGQCGMPPWLLASMKGPGDVGRAECRLTQEKGGSCRFSFHLNFSNELQGDPIGSPYFSAKVGQLQTVRLWADRRG
jgi:hypothetical protein